MRTITERFYSALESQLNEISFSGESLADQYKMSIVLCKKAMAKLKNYISSYSFKTVEDEIHFFKVVKPQFYSKYIYFISIYNFLMKRPPGGDEHLKDYINSELADLKRYFDHNAAFYQYYRSGSAQMDQVYFTRGGFDVHVELEKFEEDELYSTSHDYKLSNIIANEKYEEYLNLEIQKIIHHDEQTLAPEIASTLKWTASKTDLVELIYALIALRVFNSGDAEIKSVVFVFESVFHVNLGSYYHKYLDICRRKKERTSFIDKLKFALLSRIDEKIEADGSIQQFMKFD